MKLFFKEMNWETKSQDHRKVIIQSGILEIVSHNKILKFREDFTCFSDYLKILPQNISDYLKIFHYICEIYSYFTEDDTKLRLFLK